MVFEIRKDDLSGEDTLFLLRIHLEGMRANSPPGSVFALDLSGLKDPKVTVWAIRWNQKVVGIGALKELGAGCGELKSMRTHPDHLRQGVAGSLLDYMITEARGRGLKRLSLETGSGPAFEAALALYGSRGFEEGDVFSDYERTPFNRFFHLPLCSVEPQCVKGALQVQPSFDAEKFAQDWITAWNSHDLDSIISHYAVNVVLTSPVVTKVIGEASGTVKGKSALREYFQKGLELFPSLQFTLIEVMQGLSSVVLYYENQRGTRTGEFMEINADGKVVRVVANYSL